MSFGTLVLLVSSGGDFLDVFLGSLVELVKMLANYQRSYSYLMSVANPAVVI